MFTATGFMRDVRRGDFDVHGERRRVAAQSLRTDAELVHGFGQLGLERCALRVSCSVLPSGRVAARSWPDARRDPTCRRCRPRRSSAGSVLPPARARIDDERLIASMPSAGIAICRNELFSEPEPFGIISISSRLFPIARNRTWITGTRMPQEVCSFSRVSGCTTDERSECPFVARSQPRRMARVHFARRRLTTSRPMVTL